MRELLNEWALLMVTAFILRRQESGENPTDFCYRRGVRLNTRMRRG